MEMMSWPGSFSAIQRDSTSPMPPPWLNPAMTAQATQKFLKPRTGPTSGLPSGANVNGPVHRLPEPTRPVPEVPEADLEVRREPLEASAASCIEKSSGVFRRRPDDAVGFVSTDQHTAAFLAQIDLAA